MHDKVITFVGAGNMAQAIISAMLNADLRLARPKKIICNDIMQEKLDAIKDKYGIYVSADKSEAVSEADIIFLAVKPQNIAQTLEEIKPFIKKGALVISIAAGITTKFIEESLGGEIAVVRAMPNTPIAVGLGATALCSGKFADTEDLQSAKFIFGAMGISRLMSEDKIDAVTALSGSGPAYVFYLCELMQNAGEELGLDKMNARDFAVQTVFGAGKMLAEAGADAAVLRQNVTSPNGTTQAALKYFKSQNLSDIVLKAMEQAAQRSKELSK
ncbi:MAG: pyrroline-5-carboxylate reductase [Endomicrobia bacterium]|jgi:pyrroline-5-carboxylate reductase|nr:pyrroline-5-carboxylate reductase [Endomicrobiia bacterium]